MNREIKFRAFIGSKMIEWELLKHIYRMDEIFSGKIHYIIMQFTGLLDKNGKEIFEGDIVKHKHFATVVEYDKEFARYKPFQKNDGFDITGKDVEVIGNIFQNPKMLENND